MSHRLSLRVLAVATAATAAVIVPAGGAFADSTPAPARPTADRTSQPVREAAPTPAPAQERSGRVPRGGVDAGDKPAPAQERSGRLPRGGVDAGERPAGTGSGNSTALAGSAAGVALLAGAVVIRRRTAGPATRVTPSPDNCRRFHDVRHRLPSAPSWKPLA
ncbi:hypothetical protein, partial [Streptomyces sp. NPDC051098]|uniref:hypothetical protein n=1 Tax=Streptomyces sp. NPDC051098 TaxID=3155411 RepID=UPI0034367900